VMMGVRVSFQITIERQHVSTANDPCYVTLWRVSNKKANVCQEGSNEFKDTMRGSGDDL